MNRDREAQAHTALVRNAVAARDKLNQTKVQRATYRSKYGNLVRAEWRVGQSTVLLTFNPGSEEQSKHAVDRATFDDMLKTGDLK